MARSTVILLTASMAALLGAIGAARADVVYEWTDAHGQVHYTDQWVPGAKVVMTGTSHGATDANAMKGIQKESDAASQQIKQQQEAQAVQQDEAKVRAARCTQEKAQYQRMIESRRIYTTGQDGQRQYMSDADADAARLKVRQAMDADCGSGG